MPSSRLHKRLEHLERLDDLEPSGGRAERSRTSGRRAERSQETSGRRAERSERADRPGRAQPADRTPRPGRPPRTDRPDRDRPDRPERPERPGRPERPAPPERPDDPLLTAKLSVPRAAPGLVHRQRLLDRLTLATQGPLTVITGAAGVGKTTLAASWTASRAAGTAAPVAWVTLDREDTPGVFWRYVVEALLRTGVVPEAYIGVPACTDEVDHSLLVRIAAALERLPGPLVLVLDGFDLVPGREVRSGVRFVLEHAGPLLRLVVIGREDPLLPLHRYRAEGRLAEIRGADLAFTRREAAALLRGHGVEPDEGVVGALIEHTEGWATGLRLCALAMAQSDDPACFARSFTASEQAVADYLLTEVLAVQPPATRELLLRVGILDQVHPDLADALTGRQDSERILRDLVRAHAFLEPINGTHWHRLHPLFAETLRAHLRCEQPGLEPGLHRRAAQWFAEEGPSAEAVEHFAAAGDWGRAASLAVRQLMVGTMLAGPGEPAAARTFSRMPDDVPGAAPALVAAACCLSRQDLPGCRSRLDQAQRAQQARRGPQPAGRPAADGSPETDGSPDPDGHLDPAEELTTALLRLLAELPDDRTAEALAHRIAELMAALPPAELAARPEIDALRRYGLACALLRAGRPAQARAELDATVRGCPDDATVLLRHQALGRLALVEAVLGALGEAEQHGTAALGLADRHGIPPTHGSGAGHLALATVAVERGDAHAAGGHLDRAEALTDTSSDPVLLAERCVLRSAVELALGRRQAAVAVLDAAGPTGCPWPAARLAIARSAAALAQGDPATAVAVLDGVAPDLPARAVALGEAHLAAGRAAQATPYLAHAHAADRDATTATDVPLAVTLSDRVRAQLLHAHAALLDGDEEGARAHLAAALDTARPERLRRPFTDAGPWLRGPLARLDAQRGGHNWLTRGSGAGSGPGAGYTAGAGAAYGTGPDAARDGDRGRLVVEELSPREKEVLEQVARMMSTAEVAAELHLSVNTVKTHLRSVYHKLCVSRRRDAVDRARELHIL
ncbi:LuxR C-terminal-related transcriptional regulator [Streptomyces sp. WAC06614]|uniref:LuxR C-terminal-related transcriptional regulator n=1 Tax=Streptomyces sp. WAC06614 TaxID=2487416 RepID=UPI000F79A7EF|nr:LuxR C-terminal-related transcriptional regulator [Streptomyces sp. WAC06614]RSS78282.1 LuxR family transcriptional regulator [Streptomyces sp. WAC06614]